jgi:hypothetical protein
MTSPLRLRQRRPLRAVAAGLLFAAVSACGDAPDRQPANGKPASARLPSPARPGDQRETIEAVAPARISRELIVRAFARVENDTLVAAVFVTNTSAGPAEVEHGACPAVVRAYRPAAGAREPAWRSDAPLPVAFSDGTACTANGIRLTLPPHVEYQPFELRNSVSVDQILGDSLPEGTYRIVLVPDLGDGTAEVPAGAVQLRRRRGPGAGGTP